MNFPYLNSLILLSLLSFSVPIFAHPEAIQHIHREIPSGSIVDGSVDHGGIQPHYIIDFDDEAFTPLRKYAQSIRNEPDISKRIELLKSYITSNVLVHKEYNNPAYIKLLHEYKSTGRNIPLSSYLKGKAGVCREHALIFHLALKEAGIKNAYLYARVFQGAGSPEDHAFNVIELDGEKKVYDIYNSNFDKQSFNALLQPGGVSIQNGYKVGIDVINEYPAVHQKPPPNLKQAHCVKQRFKQFFDSIALRP